MIKEEGIKLIKLSEASDLLFLITVYKLDFKFILMNVLLILM